MNCALEGNCVKVLGKAIQALSRIGNELWFDPLSKGLALRSVNSAHSAYACFLFSPLFFQRYILSSGSENGSETIKCKLIMKSVLPLFRCLTSIERNVELCQISIGDDQVKIQFSCRNGIIKTHNLRYQDSEPLQAVFAPHLCPNVLKAPARLLGDMVRHFPVYQEEITLSISPQRLSLRNYYEGGKDHMKMMYTEMSLHPDEFDYFHVGVESDITFCLKELRGLLSFAESLCLPVSVHFDAAGKPVCFSIEDMVLEATLVLATLIDSDSSSPPCQPTETPVPTSASLHTIFPLSVSYTHITTMFREMYWDFITWYRQELKWRAEASTPRVGCCELDTILPEELVPSSQGSPIMHPAAQVQLQTRRPDRQGVPEDAYATASTSPASSMICSLLFRALSSQQDADGCSATLPVLACYSDVEEDMEDDCPRSQGKSF